MRKRALIVIGVLLFVLSQIGVNFLIYKYKNSNVEIPKVQLRDKEYKTNKSSFAIMLEQDDGSYATTDSNSFNQSGYTFNSEKSGCIDTLGNIIENSLSYNESTKGLVLRVNGTSYCYAYFDKEPSGAEVLINSGNLWQSGLDGDGYRYTGTNPNNYICFGTTDKDTCTGNTDAYMYRIIGVFADSSETKYMKLIKKEALNTKYTWNANYQTDVNWGASTLYKKLNDTENGSTVYLKNSTYMPADGSKNWSDRIADWTWNTVNTKAHESSGANYYNGLSPSNIYLHENNKTGAPSGGVHETLPDTKIGLMYVSDYLLALGTEAKNMTTGTYANRAKLKTGWMHISHNDSGASNASEWTISRYGYLSGYYYAWNVDSDGSVNYPYVYATNFVRPVFYLNSDEVIKSGTGTLLDPYILGA